MKWYYESNGHPQGPILETELRALKEEGKITGDSLVWREGMPDWAPLQSVPPFSGPLQAPSLHGGTSQKLPNLGKNTASAAAPSASAAAEAHASKAPPAAQEAARPTNMPPPPGAPDPNEEPGGSTALDLQDWQGQNSPWMTMSRAPQAGEGRPAPAWEAPGPSGPLPAFFPSISQILLFPKDTFDRLRRSGGWGAPLSFLVATNLISTLLAMGTLRWLPKSDLNLTRMLQTMAPKEITAGMVVGTLLLSTLLLPLTITVKAFILHSFLRIGARSTHPFEITFRALCYAAGAASTLWIIPFCATGAVGFVHQPELTEWTLGLALLVSETWSMYVILRAMSCAHRMTLLRVVLVIALPALIAFLLVAISLGASAPAV